MGKTLHDHHPRIFLQGNDPTGCMWGVLHVLNYQNWRQIKKRIPHKKGGSGSSKHASIDSLEDNTNALKINTIEHCDVGNEDLIVDDKSTQCSTPSKGSVASRLKALISDEISKFKGRHHRSATCPVQSQLTRTNSIHHLEPSYEDIIALAKLHEESSMVSIDDRTSSTSNLMDSVQLSLNDQKFEECETLLTDNPLKLKQFETTGKKVINHHSFIHKNSKNCVQNSMHGNQINFDSPTYHTQEMLDALDMVNTNKDLILEILKSSGSRLEKGKLKEEGFLSYTKEENLQNIGYQESKLEENKSKEYFRSKSTPTIAVEYRADGLLKLNQAMAETTNNQLRKIGHKQVVIKRFKDLRHKIKHAIKESKHEKHRIAMDAILHKIPHRHGFSKDLRKEIFDQTRDHYKTRDFRDSPRSSYESDPSLPSTIKSKMCITSRTSSFSKSLDRYCQLYECSFNKDAKHYYAETSRLRSEHENLSKMGATKSMRRIFSLPNIKYTEAYSDAFVANQIKTLTDGVEDHDHPVTTEQVVQLDIKFDLNCNSIRDLDKSSISNDEGRKEPKIESISKVELDANVVEIVDNASNMITHEMEFENKPQFVANSTTTQEVGTSSVFDSKAQEIETIHSPSFEVKVFVQEDLEARQTYFQPTKLEILCEQLEELSMDTSEVIKTTDDKNEFSCNSLHEKSLQSQVKAKDKVEFDYVRDILDISGLIKNKPQGTWHSEDQPLDRSLLEEMKGYMFFDTKGCGSEESGSCYQMLLFDLINEVLMEIYARSYAYYPKPLTSHSQIRPIPIGNHVFEEVWDDVGWYLNSSYETDDHRSLDYVVSRDLAKRDGWMNIQNEAGCVGLELEDIIFDNLLQEIICS